MKLFLLLMLFALALALIVFTWGAYETLRAAVDNTWRPTTTVALLAAGIMLLLIFVGLGDLSYWWELPDAVACADNAEIIMEAIPGPASGGLGEVEVRDLFNCTVYWYR